MSCELGLEQAVNPAGPLEPRNLLYPTAEKNMVKESAERREKTFRNTRLWRGLGSLVWNVVKESTEHETSAQPAYNVQEE